MEEYRHLNIKLTPQRLAILGFLKGNKSHPSAEDIFKAVQKQFPTMSFATVYNTLEALKNKGNIIGNYGSGFMIRRLLPIKTCSLF